MLLKNKKTPVEQLRDDIEQLLDDKKFGTAAEKAAELVKLDPRNYKNYLLQCVTTTFTACEYELTSDHWPSTGLLIMRPLL